MTKIIHGEFDLDLAKRYTELIYQFEESDKNENEMLSNSGAEGKVLILGVHAVKYPYVGFEKSPKAKEKLIHEFDIATGLEQIGLNVPKMHAVCQNKEFPFLIMSRLSLTPFEELTRKQKTEAIKQFSEQFVLARSKWYIPGDTNYETNYGFEVDERKGYFYDFTGWRKI